MNITSETDKYLSALTVRLRSGSNLIGTGSIYFSQNLKEKIYILTASHCLFEDRDKFTKPRKTISIDFFCQEKRKFLTIKHEIDYKLVSSSIEKDVAVLVIPKQQVPVDLSTIPEPLAVKERQSATNFVVKGYPQATKGEELACVYPTWIQEQPETYRFQLNLNEDYNDWSTQGFSGAGVFLIVDSRIYLFGIFTRFRSPGKGKTIYCQFVDSINQLLVENYRLEIPYNFWGEHGLTPDFFTKQINTAIQNLGPRFNETLNFRLPIAYRFNDIAKDMTFRRRLEGVFDKWLVNRKGGYLSSGNQIYNEIQPQIVSLQETVSNWIKKINWSPDQIIDINSIINKIDSLSKQIDTKTDEVYKLQYEARKTESDEKIKSPGYRPPFESEINYLRGISEANNNLYNELEIINVHLSNYPYLLVNGEAGCGKSHLFGDIANSRSQSSLSTILLLGQLFKIGTNVWPNIFNQLNLSCSKKDFLVALNSIGKQQGNRVLILIDALNEGAGKELWNDELAGFLNDFIEYPFIGVVMSVRSTYFNAVVPESIRNDTKISKIEHQGFKGNEYAALRLFCQHYSLDQPSFPILAPEFTNPLFLQVICQGIKASGINSFPQGFQGMSSIFKFYLSAISQKLIKKREEYELKPGIAEEALKLLAQECFEQENTRVIPLDKCVSLFENKFPTHKFLLSDLIHENVFTQNLSTDYKSGEERDVVYFAYERFGDYFIAEKLLSQYETYGIKQCFNKDNPLGKLMSDSYWRNAGLVDVLSVLLPERYNLEIYEVYDWIFDDQLERFSNLDNRISYFLIDSLKWRTVESINSEKIISWIQTDQFKLPYDDFLLKVVELSTIPSHPFNSDLLFRFYQNRKLPERDAILQQHCHYYTGTGDDGNAYPIQRLIDWCWQPKISYSLNQETARLAAQTLAWVLSSTSLPLRDKTTKALVNLLEEQPLALLKLIAKFSSIDDMYILERLYAVAYGCVLRTSKLNSIKIIAQFVYEKVFKKGKPPVHLLLRDYARNTIEYAIVRGAKLKIEISKVRPPYNTPLPKKFPTEKSMAKYHMDHNDPDYRKNNGHAYNKIHFSVLSWDFGRYTVDSAVHHLSPISFRFDDSYKHFLKNISNMKVKNAIKTFVITYEWVNINDKKREVFERSIGKKEFDQLQKTLSVQYFASLEIITRKCSKSERKYFLGTIIPHLKALQKEFEQPTSYFDSKPIRRWIVKRAFDLGYNVDLHGRFDTSIERYNDRSKNKIERIGKKYQWIAFYEILAILLDNYRLSDRYGHPKKEYNYEGPWQLYLRDVDPAFVTKDKNGDEDDEDDAINRRPVVNTWYFDYAYNYWAQPTSEWIENKKDLPDPINLIRRIDAKKEKWLYLNVSNTWQEPKQIGKDVYDYPRKSIWYLIQGILVKKRDKTKIINWLNKKNFRGGWLPESNSCNSNLFNRENYWSPIAKARFKETANWENLEDTDYKIIVSTSQAVGEISDDNSGAHFIYDMPCKEIFDGLKLRYGSVDGEFIDSRGNVIATRAHSRGLLIKEKPLLKFLKKNNLEIIWTLLGEKQSYGGHQFREENQISTVSGVFLLEKQELKGKTRLIQD